MVGGVLSAGEHPILYVPDSGARVSIRFRSGGRSVSDWKQRSLSRHTFVGRVRGGNGGMQMQGVAGRENGEEVGNQQRGI